MGSKGYKGYTKYTTDHTALRPASMAVRTYFTEEEVERLVLNGYLGTLHPITEANHVEIDCLLTNPDKNGKGTQFMRFLKPILTRK